MSGDAGDAPSSKFSALAFPLLFLEYLSQVAKPEDKGGYFINMNTGITVTKSDTQTQLSAGRNERGGGDEANSDSLKLSQRGQWGST